MRSLGELMRSSEPIPFDEFSAALAQRRAELGSPVVPRNTGTRRTESKQALLRAIAEAGGQW